MKHLQKTRIEIAESKTSSLLQLDGKTYSSRFNSIEREDTSKIGKDYSHIISPNVELNTVNLVSEVEELEGN